MENCNKCANTLLFGKGTQKIPWCPNCEGIEVISKEEALEKVRKELKDTNKKINELIVGFQKESLLISLYITREGFMHDKILNQNHFMSITELMKKTIEMDFNGKERCDPMSDEFQQLLRCSEKFSQSKIIMRLLLNGWGNFISIPKKDLPEYCFEFDKSIKVDGIIDDFSSDNLVITWKFTYQWHKILENFEENGLHPKTVSLDKAIDLFTQKLKLNEFWHTLRVKLSLELSAGNNQTLDIDSQKNIRGGDLISYLKILDEIISDFPFEIDIIREHGSVKFKARPVDFVGFLMPFVKNGLPLDKFKEFFFSLPFTFRCLGGFFLTSDGLFVGRQTLRVISAFLKAKYYRDYLDGNHDVGDQFENLVAEELQKVGINFNDPRDPRRELRNIKDDEDNPTLEIDILASANNKLFVIDCKAMVVSSDFISNAREGFVKSSLKDEIIKQRRRVCFVRNNMQRFGFDPNQFKVVENCIVTFNKEPINRLEDINIICVRELASLNLI